MTFAIRHSQIERGKIEGNMQARVIARSYMRVAILILVLLSLGVAVSIVNAESDSSDDLSELSLEELLKVPIAVASQTMVTTREAPGIVTLITSEEIERSGARDLIDVLRLVPGFDFAADVWGTVGPSIRGIYNSGKISFLIDGNEFIDRLYSNVMFGNHFPVDQIQQIEIIRGPGSVLYGGTAEMAVVNIITKKGKNLNGIRGSFLNGWTSGTNARANLNVMAGKEFSPDRSAYASVFLADGIRSDSTYTDAYGASYEMKEFSDIDSLFVNTGLQYEGASVQWILDRYALVERDHYNLVIPEPVTDHFYSTILDAKYEYRISDEWKILPRFQYSRQIPWFVDNRKITQQFYTFYKAVCDRYTPSLVASYNTGKIDLLGGAEFYYDAIEFDKDSYNVNTATNLKQDYSNVAAFAQGSVRLSFGNLTAGARYENHSRFGSTFVPRFSFTKVFERIHLKALYSYAFRAPNIESIRFNARIKPETTKSIEFETGYQPSDKMLVTVNLFDVTVEDPILYVYEHDRDNYYNFDRTGSRGIEAEYRIRDKMWGYASLNYSYYKAKEGAVAPYQPIDYQQGVLVSEDAFLGIPQHKIALQGSIDISRNVSVSPSLVHLAKRYGYQSADQNGNLVLATFSPVTLVNLFLLYKNLGKGRVDLGIGVYDLLGENYAFVASYNSGHAPLPGPTREVAWRLSCRL